MSEKLNKNYLIVVALVSVTGLICLCLAWLIGGSDTLQSAGLGGLATLIGAAATIIAGWLAIESIRGQIDAQSRATDIAQQALNLQISILAQEQLNRLLSELSNLPNTARFCYIAKSAGGRVGKLIEFKSTGRSRGATTVSELISNVGIVDDETKEVPRQLAKTTYLHDPASKIGEASRALAEAYATMGVSASELRAALEESGEEIAAKSDHPIDFPAIANEAITLKQSAVKTEQADAALRSAYSEQIAAARSRIQLAFP